MTDSNPHDIREKAFKLAQRAAHEPAFASSAKANPLATLIEAGIPEETARTMLHGRPRVCTDTTCWTSDCPATCIFTTIWY